ncbi:MAG: hypothetical protein AB7T49_18065 [Oligoflexales bacterium]
MRFGPLLPVLFCVGMIACGKDTEDKKPKKRTEELRPESAPTGKVTYDSSIKHLIAENCLRCHGSSVKPSLATWDSVEAVKEKVVIMVESGSMPPRDPLEQNAVSEFVGWREGGFEK